ncbi:DUF6701 domain-containing protein [Marinimicrobium locisalis]|uniref:DUF6701 domain-containing protein n=1 Tax=Marinimicrobium locisalis TaxID=546022 RepID=UPI003221C02E
MNAITDKQAWIRHARWLAVILLASWASPAWSAACDAVFTNGVQSHSSGGSINANFQTQVTGGGSELDTPLLTTGNQVTCGGSSCTASGSPAATGSPDFVRGSGVDGGVNAAGPKGGVTTVSEGDYSTISVRQERVLNFSTTGGTYLMESLTSNYQSEVQFSAGDYWIAGDMTIGQETELVVVSGGTVRIFVDGDVSIGYAARSSGFNPEQLLIYATGNITFADQVQMAGFLYAGSQFQSGFQSSVVGAVSGGTVNLANETSIDYPSGVLDGVEFAPFCRTGPPKPVSYWRMDETLWNGTAGEVQDTSGNGNHGTAQGDASTDNSTPAIAGDPGSCGYGQFDGSGDYISVPGLSNTLNATASLAFWIRTSQVGSDTAWQAPGVAGVEEAGGTDDIFWGWLDSQGRIGVSIANDNSTKSLASINDGSWHHVVLTRDHQAGEFRIYIDGALDNNGSIATGVIGNGYDRIGSIMDTGGTHEYLDGQLDEVRVYDGVLGLDDVQQIFGATHPCPDVICPNATAEPGLMGNYYNTQDLDSVRDSPPTATRVDGPIAFTWNGDDGPTVLGQGSDFSILWNGKLLVSQSGDYEFTVVSDDGVRLLLDGQTLIDEWYDHDDQAFNSAPQPLAAGQVYDLQLEYYENQGDADIELYWSRPGGGSPMNQQLIPAGNVEGTAPGLYHCPQTAVAYYTVEHGTIGLTCEAQLVTVTARDSNGDAMVPQAGTEIEFRVVPAGSGASWVGGNFYTFSGVESFVERYLTHTEPTTVTPEVLETTGSASGVGAEINFVDQALRFYGNRNVDPLNPPPVPTQVAGRRDPDPTLRVVRTDDETGACEAAVTNQNRSVDLAFECRNPTQCIAGQTLTLNDQAVTANNRDAALAYTSVSLSFDNDGFASIPLEYSDVGQVRLHGRVEVPVENDPNRVDTVSGDSNEFIVRPYTLAVTAVRDGAGADAPGWGTNAGQDPQSEGFVAAGETFSVTVEARNERDQLTPNFGNETTPESVQLATPPALVYPAGGDTGTLANALSFSRTGPGQLTADTLTWDNVGAIALTPQLDGDGYQGTGALVTTSQSDAIGRFYPWDYAATASDSVDTCSSFSYLQQPAVGLSVTVVARNLGGNNVSNYDNTDLAYQQVAAPAATGHVAENAGSGNGDVFNGRVQATFDGEWDDGTGQFDTNTAMLRRASQPDGPWPSLRIGLTALSDPDNRPLTGYDMNADTTGDCTASNDCNAVALGDTLELRFGRLKLENAFGPEVLNLPAPFYTEYWNGTEFIRNADDSCTRIPRSAITYEPTGTLTDDSNRTVPIGSGTTTGQYDNLDAVGVNINNSYSGQTFTAPGEGNTGSFDILVNLTDRPWLIFDWNRDGDHNNDINMPPANIGFGSYRGHDRIIYWREVLE